MAQELPHNGYVLGLDVGEKRIGAAIASVIAKLPQPVDPIAADDNPAEAISQLIEKEDIQIVVIGIPRNLDGEETAQSRQIRDFAANLATKISTPIAFADESLSSTRADELGKSNTFKNVSQDSLAACFILEEFLGTMEHVIRENDGN